MWSNKGEHDKDAEWLNEFKRDMDGQEKQEKMIIAVEKVRKMLQKILNWKAPGADMVQGFWFKNFRNMHDRLVSNFSQCTDEGKVLEWMTKGRTFLLQKDIDQGNEPSN